MMDGIKESRSFIEKSSTSIDISRRKNIRYTSKLYKKRRKMREIFYKNLVYTRKVEYRRISTPL